MQSHFCAYGGRDLYGDAMEPKSISPLALLSGTEKVFWGPHPGTVPQLESVLRGIPVSGYGRGAFPEVLAVANRDTTCTIDLDNILLMLLDLDNGPVRSNLLGWLPTKFCL